MTATEHQCDVAVIGGGPAGSTAATLLAQKGWNVALFERARHPRFHIGESLLPMNLPIFKQLGVLDRVKEIGVHKPGGEFYSAKFGPESSKFDFSTAIDNTWPHAYQVKREQFDRMLFENAREKGAQAFDETRVEDVSWDAPDKARLSVRSADGQEQRWNARFVVDASGRDTFFGKKLGIKKKNDKHASAALFGHFKGFKRNPEPYTGLVSVYWFEHGWFWVIPLRDDITSVGAVCDPEYLRRRDCSPEEYFQKTLALAPAGLQERMKDTTHVGKIQATGNYSYRCDRMTGPGYVMVGDAFAFVDPVFSSGVLLGMQSAVRATQYVDAELAGSAEAPRLRREFERKTRHGVKTFTWMISRFNSPAMARLLMMPGNPFRVRDAVVSLLCGDVFRRNGVMWRFTFFKAVYYLLSLQELPEYLAELKRRRARVKAEFTGGTLDQDPA